MDLYDAVTGALALLAIFAAACQWALDQRNEWPSLRAYATRLTSYQPPEGGLAEPFTIANLSALPDVLFRVRVWAKFKDGWHPSVTARVLEKPRVPVSVELRKQLPINLAPHQIAVLYLHLVFEQPLTERVEPKQYKVELTGLGGRTHRMEVVR